MGLLNLQCDSTDAKESEASRFNRFARKAFKDDYPSLADQILGDFKIREEICLDLGCDPG